MSYKSKIKLGIMAFTTLIAALVFIGCASADTIYVPTDYPTIQQAIDAASPGDTVFVYNGTYYEGDGVKISKDRITLQGEDANTTTIHGKWTAEKVVHVNGSYVNVSGFSVTGSTQMGCGICVGACTYMPIPEPPPTPAPTDNCIISDNNILDGYYGIYLSSSNNSIVSRNNASEHGEFEGNIYLKNSNNCLISDNIANNNNYGSGISLRDSGNCKLENNTANLNDRGICLSSSNNCSIVNNIANSNDRGICLSSSNNCSIVNNIANSNYYSIYLGDSSNSTLENNIANSNRYGIGLYSNNCSITNNIADSNDYGILLGSSNNSITENNVSNSREYGIYLDWSGNNEIYHNNFIDNNEQAYDHHGFNKWDKGPIIGGNYWSDHVCHGNPSNGTEPYTNIDTNAGAVDNYPFEDPDGWVKVEEVFDTGSGTYPSIMGIHNGTITPLHKVIASKLYTYACKGTGGHSEFVRIYNESGTLAVGCWDGYQSDYHNITLTPPITLLKDYGYNYTIITGSYPQIIHKQNHTTLDGSLITCTEFIDANGRRYNDWIPAIRLE